MLRQRRVWGVGDATAAHSGRHHLVDPVVLWVDGGGQLLEDHGGVGRRLSEGVHRLHPLVQGGDDGVRGREARADDQQRV